MSSSPAIPMSDKVNSETVRHVAHLARIQVADGEVEAIAHQLSKVLGFVAVLDELDTSHVEPTESTIAPLSALRADLPQTSWSSENALKNASDSHDGFIRVPKVLDQGDA